MIGGERCGRGIGFGRRGFGGDDDARGERLERHRNGKIETLARRKLDCALDASEGGARNRNAIAAGRQDQLERAVRDRSGLRGPLAGCWRRRFRESHLRWRRESAGRRGRKQRPVSVAADWAALVWEKSSKRNENAPDKTENAGGRSLILSSTPSRAGVRRWSCTNRACVREPIRMRTPPVSWLGGKRSSGAFPSVQRAIRSPVRKVARPLRSTALQSRGGDGFAPSSRARSLRWMNATRGRKPRRRRIRTATATNPAKPTSKQDDQRFTA